MDRCREYIDPCTTSERLVILSNQCTWTDWGQPWIDIAFVDLAAAGLLTALPVQPVLATYCMAACTDIDSQRPPGGDGAAISGVHRHVGLLQERPGGIGAANGDIETLPRRCHNRQ